MPEGTSTARTDDYYRILGIGPEAGHEEMRAAYRAKLRLWHPDLVAGATEDLRLAATEMTARLNEAYGCLNDPARGTAHETTRHASTPQRKTSSSVWSHLMRWSGWILIGGCAVFLGIPAIVLVLMAVFAAPFFGLVMVALISSRLESRNR